MEQELQVLRQQNEELINLITESKEDMVYLPTNTDDKLKFKTDISNYASNDKESPSPHNYHSQGNENDFINSPLQKDHTSTEFVTCQEKSISGTLNTTLDPQ